MNFNSLFMSLILLIAGIVYNTNAQQTGEDCGTGDAPQYLADWLMALNHDRSWTENQDTVFIGLQLWLIHAPGGLPAIRVDSLMNTVNDLNRRYAPARMQFYLADMPRFLPNATWNSPPNRQIFTTIADSLNLPRVVNIYFSNLSSLGLCGFAWYPNSGPGGTLTRGGAIMSYSCSSSGFGTLAHELGHYFSLPHPHNGTSNDPQSPLAERVTRNFNETLPRFNANCNASGDFFCDTPADPFGDRWGCVLPRNELDLNSDVFRPDSSLVMSYAGNGCRDRFSEQQFNAMYSTVEVNNAPRGYLRTRPSPPQMSMSPIHPILTHPAAGQTDVQPNFAHFNWEAVPNANWYHFRIKRSGLAVAVKDTLVRDNWASFFDSNMLPNTTYEWSVTPVGYHDFAAKPVIWRPFTTGARTATSVIDLTKTSFLAYPNPIKVGETLKIRTLQNKNISKVLIINLQGQQVALDFKMNSGILELILPELPVGSYFLRVLFDNGQAALQKIVLQP